MTVIFILLAVTWTALIVTLGKLLHTNYKRIRELDELINRKNIEQNAGQTTTHGE